MQDYSYRNHLKLSPFLESIGQGQRWYLLREGKKLEETAPERRLLCAMLHQAIDDVLGGHHLKWKSEFRWQAWEWINSGSKEPFSFLWVCDHLDVDPKMYVYNLRQWRKEGRQLDGRKAGSAKGKWK